MKFLDLVIAASATQAADPRAAPEDVEQRFLVTPPGTMQGTDLPANVMVLALEGADAATLDVEVYVRAETDAKLWDQQSAESSAAHRYYKAAEGTVTVGEITKLEVPPGLLYLRPGTGDEAELTLRVGWMFGVIVPPAA